MSSLTLVSRLSGFVKVAAIAAFYGRTLQADMLTAALVLPDLVYKFLSEGLVSSAAVPIFVKERENKQLLTNSFWSIFWVTVLACFVVSVLLALGTEPICDILMPSLPDEYDPDLRAMWIILIPYLTLGMLSGVLTSLLNAMMSFGLPAVGTILVNVSIILGTVIAYGGDIKIIAFANTVGALAQVLWLFWLIKKDDYLGDGIKNFVAFDKNIAMKYFKASLPITAWIAILPFIPVYERHLLSSDAGGIATLNYTEKLFNLPWGVISISLAHVILPTLSLLEGKERTRFLGKSLGLSALAVIPIIVIIYFGADLIVEIVFKRGKFSSEDVAAAAGLFRIYAVALLPVSLNMILNRGFFASGRFKIPFAAGIISVIIQLYICYAAVPQLGMNGIAVAYISASTAQLIILLVSEFIVSRKAINA